MTDPNIILIENLDDLKPFKDQLEQLSQNALEPNIFFEPCFIIPTLKYLEFKNPIKMVLVFNLDPKTNQSSLSGFFPFQIKYLHPLIPLKSIKILKHSYGFLSTPLIHRDMMDACLDSFLNWARENPFGAHNLNFNQISVDGSFYSTLTKHISKSFITNQEERALLTKEEINISKKKNKEYKRLERRLSEKGKLKFKVLTRSEDLVSWINHFLQIEASGWKGSATSALASHEDHKQFFMDITQNAFKLNKLSMTGLFLDENPIAMKCNFISGTGSFCFKIAYDENFKDYSPGVQLELHFIKYFQSLHDLNWVDSCAKPDHPMINHLWKNRRKIQTIQIPLKNPLTHLALASIIIYKKLRKLLPHK